MTGEKDEQAKPVKRPKKALFVIMCIVSALVVAVTLVVGLVVSPYFDLITVFTTKPDMASTEVQQANAATRDITEEVEAEGITLLKNEGDALPLTGVTKVNVFGSTAGNNFSYGGTGSGAGDTSKNVTFYQGLEDAGLSVNPNLKQFYDENATSSKDMGVVGTDWNLYELPQSSYSRMSSIMQSRTRTRRSWSSRARAARDTTCPRTWPTTRAPRLVAATLSSRPTRRTFSQWSRGTSTV
jgi:beta-glucosidase